MVISTQIPPSPTSALDGASFQANPNISKMFAAFGQGYSGVVATSTRTVSLMVSSTSNCSPLCSDSSSSKLQVSTEWRNIIIIGSIGLVTATLMLWLILWYHRRMNVPHHSPPVVATDSSIPVLLPNAHIIAPHSTIQYIGGNQYNNQS